MSTIAPDTPATRGSSISAIKIGGAAAIVIIAVAVGALFYSNRRVTTPPETVEVTPASATQTLPAPIPNPTPRTEADSASANAEARTITAIDAASTAKDAPTAVAPGQPQAIPQAAPQVPTKRVVAPAKDAAIGKKKAVPEIPPAEPVETSAPAPVAISPPAPAPVPALPPAEAPKSETVACADASNLFSRELCLFQECAKPEYRSHAECARFSGPGGRP